MDHHCTLARHTQDEDPEPWRALKYASPAQGLDGQGEGLAGSTLLAVLTEGFRSLGVRVCFYIHRVQSLKIKGAAEGRCVSCDGAAAFSEDNCNALWHHRLAYSFASSCKQR